jgi:hypothetical protein
MITCIECEQYADLLAIISTMMTTKQKILTGAKSHVGVETAGLE